MEYEKKKEKAVCGISRGQVDRFAFIDFVVYVFEPFRKRGIASKLIDFVRKDFIFGYKIPKEEIAFSQPTMDGKLFAMKYLETENILVYS